MKCKEPNQGCKPDGWPAGRPMTIKEAQEITHTLSKPGKMPGFAYSTPAHECKTGTKLRAVAGSVCANCYAYKRGRYRFQNVIDAQYKRFRSLTHPKWVEAMAAQINSKKVKFFRWHDSGDVQNLDHLSDESMKSVSLRLTSSTGCQRVKHGPRTILLKLLTILLSGSPFLWWTRRQGPAGLIPQQSQLRKLM